VHWVDGAYDTGKHVVQRRCPVLPGDSAESLAARVFQEECLAYPEALRQVLGGG
jgi:phosphoribosylglycinamide formyltransferase-1